ncbi:MAG: ATP-binding protein [[Clostridium] scindens]
MSHEIRTPMNAISGMTTIAKSVLSDREKTLDCLEKINRPTPICLALSMIYWICPASKAANWNSTMKPWISPIYYQAWNPCSGPRPRRRGFCCGLRTCAVTDRCLIADSLRLNQVLVNIIGNAIKFTSQGSVTLRVEELETSPKSVLKVSVQDTGIGIEVSAMERIFNAFEQADSRTASLHGGTGLGLSISRSLVQMMGGTLEVQSQVGKGSLFYFTLSFEYALASALLWPTVVKSHRRRFLTSMAIESFWQRTMN